MEDIFSKMDDREELLVIDDFSAEYRANAAISKAVNHLSLVIHKGEALGLVGESGAGKTTTALSILGLLPQGVGYITGGDIRFHGHSLLRKSDKEMNEIRGKDIAMVFANPLSSLNPLFTVGHQIGMALRSHQKYNKMELEKKVGDILESVGIPRSRADDYPHQFSGGMRQRVGIAAALVCSPELLLADEPTTALDVTIQAQILELIKGIQREFSSSLLMITHNLGIIAEICENVAIMYGGEIVEYGAVQEVFENPVHHYTSGLLRAIPKLEGSRERLESIPGLVANSQNLPKGCKFHPRCSQCSGRCETENPGLVRITDHHYAACWEVSE